MRSQIVTGRNLTKWGLPGFALAILCATPAYAIVGYVNVTTTNGGYAFIANPLDAGNNTLTNIIANPTPPVGCRVYAWDATNQVFLPRATFGGSGWDRNYDLPPGKGFVVYTPVPWTNTFVGAVLEGYLTNFVAGSNRFSLLGSKAPLGGPLTANLLFPTLDGASVHLFRSTNQTYSTDFTCFAGYGWFDPHGVEGTNGPACTVAEAFFVQNPGPATNWVCNFVVNLVAGSALVGPPITRIQANSGTVKLQWDDTAGGSYDIQFSTDRLNWTTIATNQVGGLWKGSLPDPSRGFFQLINVQGGDR